MIRLSEEIGERNVTHDHRDRDGTFEGVSFNAIRAD